MSARGRLDNAKGSQYSCQPDKTLMYLRVATLTRVAFLRSSKVLKLPAAHRQCSLWLHCTEHTVELVVQALPFSSSVQDEIYNYVDREAQCPELNVY